MGVGVSNEELGPAMPEANDLWLLQLQDSLID
jgi:hypothetical protein